MLSTTSQTSFSLEENKTKGDDKKKKNVKLLSLPILFFYFAFYNKE
jgi:hypothetical protein